MMSTKQKAVSAGSVPDVWRTRAHESGKGAILSADDAAIVREHIRHSIEATRATIETEESYGNRAPILQALRSYVRDGEALLRRIT